MTQKDVYGSIESVPITQEDADLLQASKPGYGTRSVLEVSLNIVNATVGSGIIGLPFALLLAGFTTGIAISVFVSILTFFAIYSLVLTGQKSQIYDFASLAKLAMGQFGFHMLNLMLFIQSAGSVISYFICEYSIKWRFKFLHVTYINIMNDFSGCRHNSCSFGPLFSSISIVSG